LLQNRYEPGEKEAVVMSGENLVMVKEYWNSKIVNPPTIMVCPAKKLNTHILRLKLIASTARSTVTVIP
jgi:hypothetical protein